VWSTVSNIKRIEGYAVKRFVSKYVFFWLHQAIGLAKRHDLDPRVFIVLSALGMLINGLYYLPWFKGNSVDLSFLIVLRILGVIGPAYIFLKGRRIAPALNASFAIGWTLTTTWHVCYYVYL